MRRSVLFAAIAFATLSCGEATAAQCPGQFDPSRLSDAELRKHGIGDVPTAAGTSRERVEWTASNRDGWVKQNYPDVEAVEVGPGWGLSYTTNQYGDITYHRKPDHIVAVVVTNKAACPDPDRGSLFLIAEDGERVPVRFHYRASSD